MTKTDRAVRNFWVTTSRINHRSPWRSVQHFPNYCRPLAESSVMGGTMDALTIMQFVLQVDVADLEVPQCR